MADLSSFRHKTADWRAQLRVNQHKTRWVIVTYVALYMLVGLLVDSYLYTSSYDASTSRIFTAMLTFELVPYATLVLSAIAGIALLITYSMYDKVMLLGTEYRLIDPKNLQNLEEKQLYNVVEEMKMAAGLKYMPRVYIIEAEYMNAFASGYSEKSAMVAITRGLISKLTREDLTAVMAHELSHIRHLDIKLTLTIAVLSNIMLMVIDILFYSVIFGRNRKQQSPIILVILILRYVLPMVTVLLSLFLSRTREYMADAGCVELMRDNQPLARALMKIHQDHNDHHDEYRYAYADTAHEDVRRASYIYDPIKAGIEPVSSLSGAFSTHPTLKKRLKALGFVREDS